MMLMFCAQKELVKEIYVVPEQLKAPVYVIRLAMVMV
jgi:hypothetical protein